MITITAMTRDKIDYSENLIQLTTVGSEEYASLVKLQSSLQRALRSFLVELGLDFRIRLIIEKYRCERVEKEEDPFLQVLAQLEGREK